MISISGGSNQVCDIKASAKAKRLVTYYDAFPFEFNLVEPASTPWLARPRTLHTTLQIRAGRFDARQLPP